MVLNIRGNIRRICEVEFYFCGGAHDDTFTHCDEMQMLNGRWYFHKTGKKYRSGNYKGLDITFGMDNKGYGGILLRSIADVDGNNYSSGPCLLVNEILETNGVSEVADIVKMEGFSEHGDHQGSLFYIEERELTSAPIYESPRFGLTLKDISGKRPSFIMQDYRYVTFPEKNKKGKPHLAVCLHRKGTAKKDISKALKSPAKSVDGWIVAYEEGAKQEPSAFEGKKLTNSDVCSLYGACSKFIY